MALKLKKADPSAGVSAPSSTPAAPKPPGSSAHGAPTPKSSGMSFLKRGKVAQETFAQEEHKSEMKQKNTLFRFWVPKDKDSSITFIDGNLVDGVLDVPFMYEHNIMQNGKWGNFYICTQDVEPCPICEGGSSPSYVGMLAVIDHSEYVSKKDNLTHKDNVKLFVAKRDTIKQLQKLAVKRGGLRGCRFDVSRTGDKSPSVGNMFDFIEKLTEEQMVAKYGDKATQLNYEEIMAKVYMGAAELRKLGFGSTAGPIGGESPMSETGNFDGEL